MTFRNEAEFQAKVCELAKDHGCKVFHPPSKVTRTAIKGFPDLVIVGGRGFIFRELKQQNGRVAPEQREWLDKLTAAKADADVWRPSDWPERITNELRSIA